MQFYIWDRYFIEKILWELDTKNCANENEFKQYKRWTFLNDRVVTSTFLVCASVVGLSAHIKPENMQTKRFIP